MPIPSHELSQYSYAAQEACRRLHEDPFEMVRTAGGNEAPRWVYYAHRLAEMKALLDVARQHGHFY